MLTLGTRYKENRLTKCSHTDKLQTLRHKKSRGKTGRKKKKQDMSTGKA